MYIQDGPQKWPNLIYSTVTLKVTDPGIDVDISFYIIGFYLKNRQSISCIKVILD